MVAQEGGTGEHPRAGVQDLYAQQASEGGRTREVQRVGGAFAELSGKQL